MTWEDGQHHDQPGKQLQKVAHLNDGLSSRSHVPVHVFQFPDKPQGPLCIAQTRLHQHLLHVPALVW